jgi:hypothetical protein
MSTPALVDYIKRSQDARLDPIMVREALQAVGWSKSQVTQAALDAAGLANLPRPEKSDSADGMLGGVVSGHSAASLWDAFEHILMFISLYVMSGSLAMILHDLIDRYVQSVSRNFYETGGYDSVASSSLVLVALSAFIVSFPAFAFLFLRITKRTSLRPETRQLLMRKVFIYLTLIVTFMILLYQVGRAIYNLIGGNLSINFALHFLVSAGITGVIFGYYLYQVQEDRTSLG